MKLLLGHGAWSDSRSMRPWVGALKKHGVDGIAIDLPRGRAEDAVDAFAGALRSNPGAAIGGHSFGGRVASLLAASDEAIDGLVLLSYPLHPPGQPEKLRTSHWPSIGCRVIALSGEADKFATLSLLRESVGLLRSVELVTYPGVGHGLNSVIDDAAKRVAVFLMNRSSCSTRAE